MDSSIGRILKGGAGLLTSDVITKGLGFAFIILAGRFLGPAEFGILALGLSVMNLARKFALFGLSDTIQRFLSGEVDTTGRRRFGAILLIACVTTLLASGALYVASPFVARIFSDAAMVPVLRVLSFGMLAGTVFYLLHSILRARERINQVIAVDSLYSVSRILLLLLFFIWVQSAERAAWAVALAMTAAAALCISFVRNLDVSPKFQGCFAQSGIVLKYSAPLFVAGLGYFLAEQVDRLMLGWLSTSSEVGIYAVTAKLALVMGALHGAVISIFKPVVADAYRNNKIEEMRNSYLFIGKWVGATNGVILLLLAGAGPWVLQVIGTEYATDTTYIILMILGTLYFIGTWVGPAGALLQMADGHRAELVNTIVFVIVNVGLNYLLIIEYGAIGAAIATFISGALRNALQVVEVAYWHGITPLEPNNLMVLVITGAATALTITLSAPILRIFIASVSAIAIAGFVLRTATDEERVAMQRLLARVGLKT